jgi:hypothetical protein
MLQRLSEVDHADMTYSEKPKADDRLESV